MADVPTPIPTAQPLTRPGLLDQLRRLADSHFGRPEPGERYSRWARQYILFHGKRHPRDLDRAAAGQFLEHLAGRQ